MNFRQDDLIKTLTFSHPTESPVQESRISDKIAAIALSYHTIGLEQTRDTRLRIASQLEVYQMLANRLDTYLCALHPEDAAVLKKHYFDGLSWQRYCGCGASLYPNGHQASKSRYEAIDQTV